MCGSSVLDARSQAMTLGRVKIDPRLLRHALGLREYGSLANAGCALGVSQSALSRSIRLLEEALGCRVFECPAREAVPPRIGQALLERAALQIEQLHAPPDLLARYRDRVFARLIVGAGPCAIARWLESAVGRAVSADPTLEVLIEEATSDRADPALRRRELDPYVGEWIFAERDRAFDVVALWHDPAVWFCRPGHPLTARGTVSGRDLVSFPLALPGLSPEKSAWIQRKRAGAGRPAGVVSCNDLGLLRRLVLVSDCIAAATPRAFRQDVREGRLIMLSPAQPTSGASLGVVSLWGRAHSAPARALLPARLAANGGGDLAACNSRDADPT
jgi:DNA-binding transcriptional LysR family regulator